MPLLRTYRCCGQVRGVLDSETVPLCGTCRGPMKWTQTRDYHPQNHWPKLGNAPAIDFNQTKGRVAPIGEHGIEINSLNDIRRIERESEKMERDGVGERYVFRKYAQNDSNMHVHTLGEAPSQGPSQDWLRKNGSRIGQVAMPISEDDAESTPLGPSTIEEKTSALPDGF